MSIYSFSASSSSSRATLEGGCKYEKKDFVTTINNNQKTSGKYTHIQCPAGEALPENAKEFLDPNNKCVKIEPSNAVAIKGSINALDIFTKSAESNIAALPLLMDQKPMELKDGDHILIELESSTMQADGCFRGSKMDQHIAKQGGEVLSESAMSESEFCPHKTLPGSDNGDL